MPDRSADVSVVIPTYNRPPYLIEAVESALRQTRPPREVIVVDDGSTDDTEAAVRRFGSAVQYVRQTNAGQQRARNNGVERAQARWVSTLDDDDRYMPSYIERVSQCIESEAVDIVYTNHLAFDETGPAQEAHFARMPPGYWEGIENTGQWTAIPSFPVERLLRRIAFFPSTMTVKKEFYRDIGGYDSRMRHVRAEDVEFLVRAVAIGRLGIVWAPLVEYRIHRNNQTSSDALAALSRLEVFELVYREHKLAPPFKAALEIDLPRRRGYAIEQAYQGRDFPTLRRLAPQVDAKHWTPARRLKWLIASLGSPAAKMTANALDKLKLVANAKHAE